MSKKRKYSKKNYKTPKIPTTRKIQNPPTIIADDIYNIEETELLANLNIFPLLIKGQFSEQFLTIAQNSYSLLHIDKGDTYACLDVNEFLKNYSCESNIRLLLSGRENPSIHHGRLIKGDILLCTDDYNIFVSDIIKNIVYSYGENTASKVMIKTKK